MPKKKEFNTNELTKKLLKKKKSNDFADFKEVDIDKAKFETKKIKNDDITIDKIQDYIKENFKEEIKDLVKQETVNSFKGLDDKMLAVARDYSKGLTDIEIKRKHNLTDDEYESILINESVQVEIRRLTYTNTFTDKDSLLRATNRTLTKLYEYQDFFIDRLEELKPEQYFKIMKEQSELAMKMLQGSNPVAKIDIIQIINNKIRDKTRLDTKNNIITIKPEFEPYIEEEDDIEEGEFY